MDMMGRVPQLAKRWIPRMGGILPDLQVSFRGIETATAILQGKGAGTGWDWHGEIRAHQRFIRDRCPTLIDVGANRGDWSAAMLSNFRQVHHHIMVEPQPVAASKLKNAFPAALVIEAAISDEPRICQFHVSDDDPLWAAASLYDRRETYFSGVARHSFPVDCVTLDHICNEYGLEHDVDFLKLDIEGAELSALRGAKSILTKIKTLSFEFGGGNINSRTFFRDFWDLLTPLGFKLWRILPGGRLIKIDHYYEDLEYFRGVSNYIASRLAP